MDDSVREQGRRVRVWKRVFNEYLKLLRGTSRQQAKLVSIRRQLRSGTKRKKVPFFVNGERDGFEIREVALLPSEEAGLLLQRQQVQEQMLMRGRILRSSFLEILPLYARTRGLTREVLLGVGVPQADLDEAGL